MAPQIFFVICTQKFGEENFPILTNAHSFHDGLVKNHQLENLSMKAQNLQQNDSFPSFSTRPAWAHLGTNWIGGGELGLGEGSKIKYVVSTIVHDTT